MPPFLEAAELDLQDAAAPGRDGGESVLAGLTPKHGHVAAPQPKLDKLPAVDGAPRRAVLEPIHAP